MQIGSGAYRYEVKSNWGDVPAEVALGTTHGVVEDQLGRIFIHHTGPECTLIFDPEGKLLSRWGADWHAGAHGMFLHQEPAGEFLYFAATSANLVLKTTLDGEEVLRITTPPRPDIYDAERRFVPTECAVTRNGEIYITDGYGQSWVHRYSAHGEYVDSFGGLGNEPGKLKSPHGIKIDTRTGEELVLVTDRGNRRLQYFTLSGEFIRLVAGVIRFPCTTIQWGEELYIPDLHSRLTVLDKNDGLVTHLGDWPGAWEQEGWPNFPREQWQEGKFSSPHDLHVDRAGNIYVAEWLSNGTGKLTKLVRQGALDL